MLTGYYKKYLFGQLKNIINDKQKKEVIKNK